MPRALKRRSAALNEEGDAAEDPSSPPPRRQRQRRSSSLPSASPSPSNASSSTPDDTQAQSLLDNNSSSSSTGTTPTLIKKLVRLALSTEYARQPLRRSDITQKIFKEYNAPWGQFRAVFAGAQEVLGRTFGMSLVELPSREKTTLKDRRAQAATQTQNHSKSQTQAASGGGGSSSNKSWILVSTLPAAYKRDPTICPPARAPTRDAEAEYTALYTFVVALIYLNNAVLTDAKLERYLKRVNADTYTPAGPTDKVLLRMVRDGYVERRRDVAGGGGGEEVVEWVVGPRGKLEVGVRGVADLVKGVYGFGRKSNVDVDVEMEDPVEGEGEGEDGPATTTDSRTVRVKVDEDELNKRLERSLGVELFKNGRGSNGQQPRQMDTGEEQQDTRRPKKGRRRRDNDGDSDGD